MDSRKLNERVAEIYRQRRAEAEERAAGIESEWRAREPRLASLDRQVAETALIRANLALDLGPRGGLTVGSGKSGSDNAAINSVSSDNAASGKEEGQTILPENTDAWREAELAYRRALDERAACLLRLGITENYAHPHYACANCRDTGRVKGKPCPHCYRQVLAMALYEEQSGRLGEGSFERFDLNLFSDTAPEGGGRSPRATMALLENEMRTYARTFTSSKQTGAAATEAPGTPGERSGRRNLLFAGPTGTGKSYLASCLGRALLERGFSLLMLGASELFNTMQEYRILCMTFNPNPERLDRLRGLYEQIFSTDFLMIDDLGTEMLTPGLPGDFLQILGERERGGRPVLISTNLGMAELKRRYDERIMSRLLGQFRVLPFAGEDLRLKLARRGG